MNQYNKVFESIKTQMKKSEYLFCVNACKSEDAIRINQDNSDLRLEFARDIDRIIHSPTYTRYIDKTQVYSYLKNDNISRRMTHVQFVSRAAKTIARALGLNEDLCEAIALGHDVGHVPFGHFGENILNNISVKHTGLGFAHNLNSVRVFKDIEKNGLGLNLTVQVLDGIMCHNGELVERKYKPIEKSKEEFLKQYEDCVRDISKVSTLIPMTLEACIVRYSDIIGYIGKDIDDARNLDVFDIAEIPNEIKNILGVSNNEIMNNIIVDIIVESYGKDYIQMSDVVYEQVKILKKFNQDYIYSKAMSKSDKNKIIEMFEYLFDCYMKSLKNEKVESSIYTKYLNYMCTSYIKNTSNEQKVIDYLASMTDSYFKSEYDKYYIK